MSLDATRELAHALGVTPLALLQANRDRPWTYEGASLAFASLRPGDVLRHPGGGEVEIVRMGERPRTFGASAIVQSYTAQLQTQLNGLPAQGAATLQQATGVNVTQTRVTQGAAAAVQLAQNGYDPSSAADNQNLVAAIAGGCCLIPAVGPALGAAVEALYQVGSAVACPVTTFFAGLGLGSIPPGCPGYQPCTTSGNWSAASILQSGAGSLPSMPQGSFAQLATGALANFAAQAANCQGSLPPGVIVDAAVNMWNQTHAGPAVAYLVPPLLMVNRGATAFGPPTLIATWGSIGSGSAPSQQAHKDPYAYYAFGPVSSIPASEHPDTSATQAGQFWPIAPEAIYNVDPPRLVMVNSGALTTGAPAATINTLIPGMPNAATQFQTGRTYFLAQTVPGADPKTGQPATSGTAVMDEATFLLWMPQLEFSPAQILWWGPTSAKDDPAGYLSGSGWAAELFALGQQLQAVGGQVWLLATYGGPGGPVPQGVYVYDVTGSMTPRQTVLAAAGLSTGAKVGIGVGVTAAAAGGMWLALGRPLTIQAAESAFRLLVRGL